MDLRNLSDEVQETYEILKAGDGAAALLVRLSGAPAWARWMDVGRAVELLHGLGRTNKKRQGAIIAGYPRLAAINTVIRSNAKWAWQNRAQLEALAADGHLVLGHPNTVRQAFNQIRNLAAASQAAAKSEEWRRLIAAYVNRHHNSPGVLVDLLVRLSEAAEDGRGEAILHAAITDGSAVRRD